MDERQRAQIELILSHEMDLALRAANNESGKIFAANAAKGLLQGGATVKQIIRAIGTQTEELLETVVAKASAVSKASGVSTLIEAAFQAHFENLDKPVFEAARIASGRAMPEPQSSVLKAARDLLEVVRADIGAKLAIARFNFDGGLG